MKRIHAKSNKMFENWKSHLTDDVRVLQNEIILNVCNSYEFHRIIEVNKNMNLFFRTQCYLL